MGSSLVTLIRNLHDRKGRRREGLALAEGVRLVEEAVAAAVPLRGAIVDADAPPDARRQALLAALTARDVPIEAVSATQFAELAGTEHPQGILAVVEPPAWAPSDLDPARGPVLVLDGVQDPGNVGTLLRTAWAFGAAGTVLLKGTADPRNAKVVRAAMGATFRLPMVAMEPKPFLAWARDASVSLWIAVADGQPLGSVALPARLALAVGNEGAGLRSELSTAAAGRVSIPIAPGVESLNVAIAAGILLHEVRRAR